MTKGIYQALGGEETSKRTGAKFYNFPTQFTALIDSNDTCNYVNIFKGVDGYCMDFCKIDYLSSGQTKKQTIEVLNGLQLNELKTNFLEIIKWKVFGTK